MPAGRIWKPFPNDVQQALLSRLPSEVESSCERADLEDRPLFRFGPDDPGFDRDVPLPVRAGLSCLTAGVLVHYWQGGAMGPASGIGTATDLLFNAASHLSLAEGSCDDASRVYEPWRGGVHSGYVLCYVADGSAVMHWSFDDPNIYAIATRRDARTGELYEWWQETGIRLGR